jgi:hypothetical protein
MQQELQVLLNNVNKRFQTTMIGSLARFEEYFGDLWENNHRDRERFEEMWEDVRNQILNNGNKQARAAVNEITDFFSGPKITKNIRIDFNKEDN